MKTVLIVGLMVLIAARTMIGCGNDNDRYDFDKDGNMRYKTGKLAGERVYDDYGNSVWEMKADTAKFKAILSGLVEDGTIKIVICKCKSNCCK